ncbi:hypothetical protein [Armatimonas rosea]|uniref:Uncharacterized protein n=1 Tax=Armatimonas rosea TaxID=685828 RepID=A0A7W9W8Y9_ARMRO|nr:hypothetical protein [Armatimonas rosea]MBB6053268.1 hypothetical protein [Armatimonas rosea]
MKLYLVLTGILTFASGTTALKGAVISHEQLETEAADIDFLLGNAAIEPHDPEATSSVETDQNITQDETTIQLLPGIAVYRPDGLLPVLIEGESTPTWCVPGDFQRYLQPGEPETRASGLVREILVGSYRSPADDDNDDPACLGTFIPDSEWDAVVAAVHRERLQLIEEIGFDPTIERPDESKPRGETWLAERSNWETEVVGLKEHIASLEAQLAASAPAPAPSALPENALELIQAAGSLSKPKAEAVLAALTSTATPESTGAPESSTPA